MTLHTLVQISELVDRTSSLDRLMGPVHRLLTNRLGLQRTLLTVSTADRSMLRIHSAHGMERAELTGLGYAENEGFEGRQLVAQNPVQCTSVASDPGFADPTGVLEVVTDRSLVVVPILYRGDVVGTLSGFRPIHEADQLPHDVQVLQLVAGLLSRRVADAGRATESTATDFRPQHIIGRSKPMLDTYELISQVAPSPTTVLLLGESGTGKELVATALHQSSTRSRGPLVRVNCAALPETLVESELFGHERGAFTGADRQRTGRFEEADGGTLFLDEIGDLTPGVQVKLLRVLQERVIERLGSNRSRSVDVRLIAATSRDLSAMVEEGTFRIDLFYRLNVFPIRMPPLRERKADILLLADHFIELFNRSHGRAVRRISSSAIDMLMAYHWPGNVRELENTIERAFLLTRDEVILGHHLPPTLQTADATGTSTATQGLKAMLGVVEREIILDALKSSGGNIAQAARALQITERIMGLRVKKYGVDPQRYRNPTKM